eukprot:CAMPEP_0170884334 /NCGR_PEP_ID=MMETSP0734-20130129/34927_1 /TAXON_ID=186038 /ORGANISM="Fragilariopsis kerguelensis, Strain L26-C5" /LENGTH=91 /DNA_ID=CAMNT_0011268945 /DNA_START=193 /DNA_END=468 /DNA_ORIENTATION=-
MKSVTTALSMKPPESVRETLVLQKGDSGTAYEVAVDMICGGQPCHILKGARRGKNRYNVRVSTAGEWSKYSKHRSFNVAEVGNVQHEHDEL